MNIPIPDIILTWQFWAVAFACYVLCEIFKQIPALRNGNASWLVNLFGILIGILLLCLLLGWSGENVIFGILAAAASTLAYELWSNILKQITGKKETAQDVDYPKVGGSD